MPTHRETRILPYSAREMFDLVADIGRYPEFLPWMAAARIRSREDRGDHEEMAVDLVVAFKLFRERFGTRVELWPGSRRIDTEYIDGPFRHLHSRWEFRDVEGGAEVKFFVDFEFRNAVLRAVIGVVFNEAMHRVVAAFERRAEALYGKRAGRDRFPVPPPDG